MDGTGGQDQGPHHQRQKDEGREEAGDDQGQEEKEDEGETAPRGTEDFGGLGRSERLVFDKFPKADVLLPPPRVQPFLRVLAQAVVHLVGLDVNEYTGLDQALHHLRHAWHAHVPVPPVPHRPRWDLARIPPIGDGQVVDQGGGGRG